MANAIRESRDYWLFHFAAKHIFQLRHYYTRYLGSILRPYEFCFLCVALGIVLHAYHWVTLMLSLCAEFTSMMVYDWWPTHYVDIWRDDGFVMSVAVTSLTPFSHFSLLTSSGSSFGLPLCDEQPAEALSTPFIATESTAGFTFAHHAERRRAKAVSSNYLFQWCFVWRKPDAAYRFDDGFGIAEILVIIIAISLRFKWWSFEMRSFRPPRASAIIEQLSRWATLKWAPRAAACAGFTFVWFHSLSHRWGRSRACTGDWHAFSFTR